MPKLTSAAKRPLQAQPPMRVVMLTMDTHLSSAANRSASLLAQKIPGLQLRMHAASEYRASDEALSKCLQDIERADLVIVTMLFMEDHFLPVLPALTALSHALNRGEAKLSSAKPSRSRRRRLRTGCAFS